MTSRLTRIALVAGLAGLVASEASLAEKSLNRGVFEVSTTIGMDGNTIAEPRFVVLEGDVAELTMELDGGDSVTLFVVVETRADHAANVVGIQAELVGGIVNGHRVLSSPHLLTYLDNAVSIRQDVSADIVYDLTLHVSKALVDGFSDESPRDD